ncbi:hypothetical protein PQX77_003518 [Marasmius sp. AFHP31]|nr:hypothetical protein PQX77_003518 [Marasmius sp. AFHP31]
MSSMRRNSPRRAAQQPPEAHRNSQYQQINRPPDGPPTITYQCDPEVTNAFRKKIRQMRDEKRPENEIEAIESMLSWCSQEHTEVLNVYGMLYDDRVHGPLQRAPILEISPGTTLDVVYFDTKFMASGMAYGVFLLPSTSSVIPDTPYDWRPLGVALFVQASHWEFEEVVSFEDGESYLIAPPGQTFLIQRKVRDTPPEYERHTFSLPSLIGINGHTMLR